MSQPILVTMKYEKQKNKDGAILLTTPSDNPVCGILSTYGAVSTFALYT